jgi:putative membrane-bound dehydrogenase-like protein
VFLQREDVEPARSSRPEPGVLPTDDSGRPLNLDFEQGDLRDWNTEGSAFDGQPVQGDTVAERLPVRSRHQGEYWIGGYELLRDEPEGRLTSAPFRVTHPWASFLVGGGSAESTRVELAREGAEQAFFVISGPSYESMQRVTCDLREQLDQKIEIRLIDENPGGWGHVNFDDFRFHEREPAGFSQPEGVPEILPADQTAFAGLTAQEAAAAMTVPDGFKVEVIAAEPDVHQPIAFTIDAKGRLWVAEAHSYPVRQPEGEGLDKILVLADEDGDGSFETRTVFAEGLNLVSGLEVGFGGVWVGAAPYLLFIPDRDGDLVPDGEPEILLDGWHYEDTHETLNAFIWGPDGWLYGCHGVFTHSRVGKPGTPDDERVPINAGVWRYHPTRHEFEVFAWGSSNPWGVDFDDKGQAFITTCVIGHLFHVIQGGRYERQAGKHFNAHVYEDIDTIADHLHWQGETPWSGNQRSGATGGGHAHCGAMIYLGDSFPEPYRGKLFMNNIHGNRVNVDSLEHEGSGFVGHHEDDFLLANDKWFRGIDLKYGPDGSVYLIDWYDEQACHNKDTEIWDRTNGRIWRVSYGDYEPIDVDLRSLSDDELCELQLHANDWYVRRARLILQERGPNPKVHERLKAILADHPQESRKLRALWALHVTDGLGLEFLMEQLGSPHEYVRAWAVQLLLEPGMSVMMDRNRGRINLFEEPTETDFLCSLAKEDPSPVVRMYLASGLQRAEGFARQLSHHLIERDGEDPNIPLLLWYGIEPWVAEEPEWALGLLDHSRIESVNRFIIRRMAEDPDRHALLTSALAKEASPERIEMMLEAMDKGLRGQRNLEMPEGWPKLYADLYTRENGRYHDTVVDIAAAFGDPQAFGELRGVLRDADREIEDRERALEALARGKDHEAVPALQSALAEPGLRGAAIRALGSFGDAGTPAAILAHYGECSDEEKRDCLNTLSERAGYARELLGAVERGEVPAQDLQAFVLRKLRALEDPEVDRLLLTTWGVFRETAEDKAAKVAELKAELTQAALATADMSQGRALFEKTCMQCHELFGQGGTLGPSLTGSNRADLDYMLENLVDPSAVIGRDYQVTMVWTQEERLVTGILSEETASAVTLRTENDTVVVPKDEIAEQRLSELSTMPEGQLESLAPDEIACLIAYLASPEQVPLPTDPESPGPLFDGVDLAGWHGDSECWSVEAGEIVGQTPGLARNEFLKSTRELSDFRLTLEVLLAGNAGNSGIQFRSREIEGGDVAGYQADIGPGWWGKLYEEHGRAVLWDDSGEAHVLPGEWNTYTIEAVGPRLRTWLNGQLCVDLEDAEGAASGIIALQIHSGGPTEVRFRNLRLELDPQLREDSR